MSEKSPVSTVEEICLSMKERPNYSYTKNEDDSFTCTVKLQWEALGNGSSKRCAKNAAAKKILENIAAYLDKDNSGSLDAKTPVSVLQECCSKARYGSPIYTWKEADKCGFLCSVKILEIEEANGTGYAKTKRNAKHLAASNLINTIQSLSGSHSLFATLLCKMTSNNKLNENSKEPEVLDLGN